MPLDLATVRRNYGNVTDIDRRKVLSAINHIPRTMAHRLDPETREILEEDLRFCERWLADPAGSSTRVCSRVLKFLQTMENSVFICHPAHVYIQSILESVYVLAEWRGLDGNKDDTSLNGIEDYGDIF